MFREGGESRDERTDVFVAVPNRSPSTTVDDPVGTVDHDRGIVRKYHLTSLVAGRERWTRVYSYVSSRVRDAYTCTHVRANLSSTLWRVPSPAAIARPKTNGTLQEVYIGVVLAAGFR